MIQVRDIFLLVGGVLVPAYRGISITTRRTGEGRPVRTSLDDHAGERRTTMNLYANAMRRFVVVLALSLSTLITAACGTLVGAGVGAAGGAAVGAATGNDPGKSALIGAGIGAAGGAIYDIAH